MFFSMKKNVSNVSVPEFREARSMYTSAIHIETGEHDILCGSDSAMYGDKNIPVTAEIIRETMYKQHEGWKWCATCASVLTNGSPSADEIVAAREK